MIKLYDSKILPILCYASEVIGLYNFPRCELVQNRHFKQFLGIRTSVSNSVALCEAGATPLQSLRQMRAIAYYSRLLTQIKDGSNALCIEALRTQFELAQNGCSNSWGGHLILLLQRFDSLQLWNPPRETEIQSSLSNLMENVKTAGINEQMEKATSTRFYGAVRSPTPGPGPQLSPNIKIPINYRIALTRLRTSSVRLDIITGAWSSTPRNERICRLCHAEIGDEEHFLLRCSALADLRALIPDEHSVASLNNPDLAHSLGRFIFFGLKRLH